MTDLVGLHADPVYFRSHDDVMDGQTGVTVSILTKWKEREARYRAQDALTAKVANVLAHGGVDPFREGEGFAMVGLVTGLFKPAEPQYRRIHFLPSVAASLRADIATALDYYLSCHGSYARYGVFTSGTRCPVWEVRGRVVWLNRMVSRWHHEICGPLGIDVLFRAIELPCDDALTFHVHANVIYHPTRYLSARKWARFKIQTAAFFGTHWDDNGKLRDVREAVKYVMKGDDVSRLLERDPAALLQLYHELKGLHLVQGLGGFRAWRRERKEAGQKVIRVYELGGAKLILVQRPARRLREDPQLEPGERIPRSNRILSFCLPRAAFCPVREPVVLVSNLDIETLWHDPDVMERRDRAIHGWLAKGADPRPWLPRWGRSPFKVHTYTTTVGAGGACDRVLPGKTGPENAYAEQAPP